MCSFLHLLALPSLHPGASEFVSFMIRRKLKAKHVGVFAKENLQVYRSCGGDVAELQKRLIEPYSNSPVVIRVKP